MNNRISYKVWERLIGAVLAWRFFCEQSANAAQQMLLEDLQHPRCNRVNAYKLPDGSFIRELYGDQKGTYVRAFPTDNGWGPVLDSYDEPSAIKAGGEWGYWNVHFSCPQYPSSTRRDRARRSLVGRWEIQSSDYLGMMIGTQVVKDLEWTRRREIENWFLNASMQAAQPVPGSTPGFREFLEDLYGIGHEVELPDIGSVSCTFKKVVEELRGLPEVQRY